MANPNQAAEMGKELYVAAMTGDVEFLQTDIAQSDEYLRRKTHENNNIIHIATLHEQHDFLQESLKRLVPNHGELISEKNSEGNTPFHVVAEVGNLNILKLLLIQSPDDDAAQRPWRIQNLKENTPLHVALIRQNAEIAKFLLEKDPDLVYVVNKSKETPLHLAVKHHVNNCKLRYCLFFLFVWTFMVKFVILFTIFSHNYKHQNLMVKHLLDSYQNFLRLLIFLRD